jgi:hypothetical protein
MEAWEKALLKQLEERPLRLGDGDSMPVRRWRARLRTKGFAVNKTGAFDQALKSATRVGQIAAKVDPDGRVGPITWKAVGKLKKQTAPPRPPSQLKVRDCRKGKNGFPVHATKKWKTRSIVQIRSLLGHYTGNAIPFLNDANFHVRTSYLDPGGAPGIAYTIGVNKDGTVDVFNDWTSVTWHCDGGFNTATLGIVFQGGAEGPNVAQKKVLTLLVEALRAGTFSIGNETWPKMDLPLTTHRHVNSTTCPGTKGEAFYRSLGKFTTSPKK